MQQQQRLIQPDAKMETFITSRPNKFANSTPHSKYSIQNQASPSSLLNRINFANLPVFPPLTAFTNEGKFDSSSFIRQTSTFRNERDLLNKSSVFLRVITHDTDEVVHLGRYHSKLEDKTGFMMDTTLSYDPQIVKSKILDNLTPQELVEVVSSSRETEVHGSLVINPGLIFLEFKSVKRITILGHESFNQMIKKSVAVQVDLRRIDLRIDGTTQTTLEDFQILQRKKQQKNTKNHQNRKVHRENKDFGDLTQDVISELLSRSSFFVDDPAIIDSSYD